MSVSPESRESCRSLCPVKDGALSSSKFEPAVAPSSPSYVVLDVRRDDTGSVRGQSARAGCSISGIFGKRSMFNPPGLGVHPAAAKLKRWTVDDDWTSTLTVNDGQRADRS